MRNRGIPLIELLMFLIVILVLSMIVGPAALEWHNLESGNSDDDNDDADDAEDVDTLSDDCLYIDEITWLYTNCLDNGLRDLKAALLICDRCIANCAAVYRENDDCSWAENCIQNLCN